MVITPILPIVYINPVVVHWPDKTGILEMLARRLKKDSKATQACSIKGVKQS
jgi:hypothetical protein